MNSPSAQQRRDPAWVATLERLHGVEAPKKAPYMTIPPDPVFGIRFRALMEAGDDPIIFEGFDFAACEAADLQRRNGITARAEQQTEQAWIDFTTKGLDS